MKSKILATLMAEPLVLDKTWLANFLSLLEIDGEEISAEVLEALQLKKGVIPEDMEYVSIRGNIGVLNLHGPIFPKANIITEWFGIGVALDKWIADAQGLVDNDQVDTILIDADTPGGVISGINEASEFLSSIKSEKKLITYSGDLNASAGYWLTSSSDKIYANKLARIGSIGVVMTMRNPDYGKDENNQPYTLEMVNTASPKKRVNPNTKEGKAEITRMLDSIASVFIETVAENRGTTMAKVESDFGQGGLLIGKDALAVGMIDGLDSFEGVVAKYSTEDAPNNFSLSSVKGESTMTLEELKAKHPELYEAIFKAGADSMQSKLDKKNEQIAGLEQTVVTLEAKNEEATSTVATLGQRVDALEADRNAREAKDAEQTLADKANALIDSKLAASDLPDRVFPKVKGALNYNAHVVDGQLDTEKFGAAIDKEIADWEAIVGPQTPPVNGLVPGASVQQDNDDQETTDAADRMFKLVGGGKE